MAKPFIQPQEPFSDRMEKALGAHKRSKELLRLVLSEEQFTSFIEVGHFLVIGGATGRTYRIVRGKAFNIHLLENGQLLRRYCAGPAGVPGYDFIVGQKLWLESPDELDFLKSANVIVACDLPLYHSAERDGPFDETAAN